MKPINRTPNHLRCSFGACPQVFELEGGRLLIVGKIPRLEDLKDVPEFTVGSDEQPIVIGKEYLVQTSSSQGQALSGHLNFEFEARAKEIAGRFTHAAYTLTAARVIAQALREASELGMGWQLIATAPKNGDAIMLFVHGHVGPCTEIGFWQNNTWWDRWGHDLSPSHWTPLPASPRGQIEEPRSGDTAAHLAGQSPDTKILPKPIIPETGH